MRVLGRPFGQSVRKLSWVFDKAVNNSKTHLAKILRYVCGFDVFDGDSNMRDIAENISIVPRGSGLM